MPNFEVSPCGNKDGIEHTYMPTENSKSAQRRRLLTALRANPINTVEAREFLGIMHPAGRINELRNQGFNIISIPTEVEDADTRRIIATYMLRPYQNVED